MNVLDTIEITKPQFTKTDWAVYTVMSADWVRVFRSSSNALAKKYGLSQASIVRFCKKLGFDGYSDFRFALYDALQTPRDKEQELSKAECFKRIIDLIAGECRQGSYDSMIQLLVRAPIVCTTGVHRSALPAQLLMHEMRLLNHLSYFLPYDQLDNFTTRLTPDDLFVAFSESGDTMRHGLEQLDALPQDVRPTRVLVSMNRRHPLRKYFDEMVWLPSSTNQALPVRMDPSTVFSFFVDLMSGEVAKAVLDKHDEPAS